MKNICFITTRHPRDDIRIFHKECKSLVENGYSINLFVSDGLGDNEVSGIKITDVGLVKKNIFASLIKCCRIFNAVKKGEFDAFHFHDPDFMFFALLLTYKQKKVFFDCHEDYFEQIRSKKQIPKFFRPFVLILFQLIVKLFTFRSAGIIGATEKVANPYFKFTNNIVTVKNFPILTEFCSERISMNKKFKVVYVGGISRERCALEMAKAIQHIDREIQFTMIGNIENLKLKESIRTIDTKNRIKILPSVGREEVIKALMNADLGLCFMWPVNGYEHALPTKIFEYMAVGIPFIGSNHEAIVNIVLETKSGLVSKTNCPADIAEKIKFLMSNPLERDKLGTNGRKAVLNGYNWGAEEKKLVSFYKKIIS